MKQKLTKQGVRDLGGHRAPRRDRLEAAQALVDIDQLHAVGAAEAALELHRHGLAARMVVNGQLVTVSPGERIP